MHGKNCGCGCHSKGPRMREVITGIYELKGENYLSPENKTMAEGFWSAGQPGKRTYPRRAK